MRKVVLPFGAALALALTMMLAGCPKKPTVQETPPPAPTETEQPAPGAVGPATEMPDARGAEQRLLTATTIYFDFDKSDIRPEFNDVIAAHAHRLAASPNLKVRLEGHTDERGSREYNIGLGERRAQAVRRALLLQGVTDAQVSTISYGEERPAVDGHDETAWAKNRRVEIIYSNP